MHGDMRQRFLAVNFHLHCFAWRKDQLHGVQLLTFLTYKRSANGG